MQNCDFLEDKQSVLDKIIFGEVLLVEDSFQRFSRNTISLIGNCISKSLNLNKTRKLSDIFNYIVPNRVVGRV